MNRRDLRASIMRDQEWDSTTSKLYSLDLSEFVFTLSWFNSVYGESTLGVVDQTEVLSSLVNADNIHETGWISGICAHFSIDLDESLHDNLGNFTSIEGILQTISEENDQR